MKASLDKEADTSGRVVKLNVGGKRVEVCRDTIRSVVSQAELAGSMEHRLASLLSGRWDVFLPRDGDGCIYLDWEKSWIMPCLDEMTAIANGVAGPSSSCSDPNLRLLPDRPQDRLGFESVSRLLQAKLSWCVNLDQESTIPCLNSRYVHTDMWLCMSVW